MRPRLAREFRFAEFLVHSYEILSDIRMNQAVPERDTDSPALRADKTD